MMRWKTVLLCGVLSLSMVLAGCGSKAPDEGKTQTPTPATSTEQGTADQSTPADVQKIIDRGVLNVGVKIDVPNFGYKDPATNEITGFEIDLAKAIAEDILGDETKINLQAVTAQTRGPLLDTGELDMDVATFTITEERKKSYNFSEPYYQDGVALMVKKDAGYTTLKDLDGKAIGVAQSATSKDAISAAADELGIKVKFSEFATYPEIKAALSSKRVDCFSVDAAILTGYLDDNVVILEDRYNPQLYGVCTKFDNKGLAERVNKILAEMNENGQMTELKAKWGLSE